MPLRCYEYTIFVWAESFGFPSLFYTVLIKNGRKYSNFNVLIIKKMKKYSKFLA